MVNTAFVVTSALVITSTVALPIEQVESREPKGFGGIIKTAGKVLSGVSTAVGIGGAVAGAVQQQPKREVEELDAREPKIRIGGVLKGAGKVLSGVSTVAGIGGAVAAATQPQAREFDDVFEYEAREFDDFELAAREPKGFGGAFKTAGKVLSGVSTAVGIGSAVAGVAQAQQGKREFDDMYEFEAREFDELETREPKIKLGKVFKTAGKVLSGASTAIGIGGAVAGAAQQQPQAREFDDVFEYEAREFDDLETREPKIRLGKAFKTAGKVLSGASTAIGIGGAVAGAAQAAQQPQAREFDELETREPKIKLGKAFKTAGKVLSGASTAIGIGGAVAGAAQAAQQPQAREFDDVFEFEAREFDELETREPKIKLGKILKGAGKVLSGASTAIGIGGAVAGAAQQQPQARAWADLEELD